MTERYYNETKRPMAFDQKTSIFLTALAIVVLLIGVYWLYRLPSPGYAVALMGVAAACMSVHQDQKWWHKSMWLCGVGVLLAVELRAIRRERIDTHTQYLCDQKKQNETFQQIISEQNRQFAEMVKGFTQTEKRVDGVLATTQGVADVSQKSLLSITGGNSFVYVYPASILGDPYALQLKVHNKGKFPLTSIVLTFDRLSNGTRASPYAINDWNATPIRTINLGTLAGDYGRKIPSPEGEFRLFLDSNGTAQYHFYIGSQKDGEVETIDFRLNQQTQKIEYSFVAWIYEATGEQHKGDIHLETKNPKNEWVHILKTCGWAEIDWSHERSTSSGCSF